MSSVIDFILGIVSPAIDIATGGSVAGGVVAIIIGVLINVLGVAGRPVADGAQGLVVYVSHKIKSTVSRVATLPGEGRAMRVGCADHCRCGNGNNTIACLSL